MIASAELKDMEKCAAKAISSEEIAKVFAEVYNEFCFIEDDLYDYEEGTEE